MIGKRILRVAAVGAAVALPLTLAVTSPASAAEGKATVTALHGIPASVLGSLGVAGGIVDVCANNSIELISDFAPGQLKTLEVDPGTYQLSVHAAAGGCASAPLLATEVTVAKNRNYTVTANLRLTGNTAAPVAPALNAFVNNRAPVTKYVSKATKNVGRVTVRHIAAAPGVDVFVNGNVAITNLTNPNQAQTRLPKLTYSVAAGLTGAGTAGIALGPVDLTVKAGYNTIVYAWGIPQSVGGEGVQVAVQQVKLVAPKTR
jgi:hypothetical protein